MSCKVKFVSRKISKIRWRPKSFSVFITGSCDDEENHLTVWKFPSSTIKENNNEEVLMNFDENDPLAVCKENFAGCVTDLKVISDELLFASSSLGSVHIYRYSDEELKCAYTWENVHWFKRDKAATTAIAVKGQEIASVGEDGRLCIFNFMHMQKLKDIECSDQCSFTTVNYIRHQEVVVGNSLGYLRLWDLRSPNVSSSMLTHSRNQSGISSMATHPTQSHVLCTGNEDGSMQIWDMRQDNQPVSLLDGCHTAAVTELLFHPSNPDFMFTCSLDGSVLQWDSSALRNAPQHQIATPSDTSSQTASTRNPWLISETNLHCLDITSFFSQPTLCVNSLDFSGSTLLWATDNEAIHISSNIDI